MFSSDIDFRISNFFDFILETINSAISELLQADRATIFIYDEDKKQLWSKVAQSSNKYEALEIRISIYEGIAGSVARTGKVLNILDAYQNPLFDPSIDAKIGYTTKSIVCVPFLNSRQKIIGVIQVLNKCQGENSFKAEDEEKICMFAKDFGIFMEVLESTLNETYQKLTNKV